MIHSSLIAVIVVGVIFASCAGGATGVGTSFEDPDIVRAPTTIALTGVRVIPMTSAERLENQTVIISGGRIQAIGPTASTPLPAGANVIEGRGRILAPALIDMHVHLRRAELPLYFRTGWELDNLASSDSSIVQAIRMTLKLRNSWNYKSSRKNANPRKILLE